MLSFDVRQVASYVFWTIDKLKSMVPRRLNQCTFLFFDLVIEDDQVMRNHTFQFSTWLKYVTSDLKGMSTDLVREENLLFSLSFVQNTYCDLAQSKKVAFRVGFANFLSHSNILKHF